MLFDRPCFMMGSLFGAAICSAAKVVGDSPFDHIGVVVRQEDGSNVLVEASFSGIAVRPLCERIRRSSANQICVRRLQASRTEDMRAEARRFVSEVQHLPYKEGAEGFLQMAYAAFRFHPVNERRRRMHAETVELSTSIARLESEQLSNSDPVREERLRWGRTERVVRAMTQRRKAMVFLERAATKRSTASTTATSTTTNTATGAGRTRLIPHPLQSPPPSPILPPKSPAAAVPEEGEVPLHEGGLFCSELVAALYQRLGFLDAPFPKSHDYTPADFAQSLENPVVRVGGEEESAPSVTEGESKHALAYSLLPASIPRGGGRVALLGGASLSAGFWVRGGTQPLTPPPPPPPLDSGADGQGCGSDDNLPPTSSAGGATRSPRSQRLAAAGLAAELVKKTRDDGVKVGTSADDNDRRRHRSPRSSLCLSGLVSFLPRSLLVNLDTTPYLAGPTLSLGSPPPPRNNPSRALSSRGSPAAIAGAAVTTAATGTIEVISALAENTATSCWRSSKSIWQASAPGRVGDVSGGFGVISTGVRKISRRFAMDDWSAAWSPTATTAATAAAAMEAAVSASGIAASSLSMMTFFRPNARGRRSGGGLALGVLAGGALAAAALAGFVPKVAVSGGSPGVGSGSRRQ
ncbi:unnamed protein product [Ascophyllum nodosum]